MTLTMKRGTTKSLVMTIKENGAAINVTGYTFWFTAKYNYEDADSAKVFQKTVGSGITLTTPASGIITVKLSPTDTSGLPAHTTRLYYDLKMKDGSSNVYSILSGELVVEPDVTNTTS